MATLVSAAIFLALGLRLFYRGISTRVAFARQSQITFAWLCIALSVTFVLFSLFPATDASGQALGFTIGGAGAFVVLIWLAAFHILKNLIEIDNSTMAGQKSGTHVSPMERDGLLSEPSPQVIRTNNSYRYKISTMPRKFICITTGDLRAVKGVDIWVNSENTDMQMSRMHERSISGLIRYEGARLDISGRPLDDLIAEELIAKTRGMVPVEPGTAVVTGSAELLRKNGVKRVIHVAAVRGEPTAGYRQLASIDRCLDNALDMAQAINAETPVQSILFPLLGAGGARGERTATARVLVSAAVNYMTTNRDHCIRTIHFLARTDIAFAALRLALDEVGVSGADHVVGLGNQ